ncbi:MAG: NTP transferase domain-containing protein [Acidimicrobiia bacterium]
MNGRSTATDFVGAILTGGRSSRMGFDKALAPIVDDPMVALVARALRDAGAAEILSVGGSPAAAVAASARHVDDPRKGNGPVAGIIAALEAARDIDRDIVFISSCDLPHLSAGTVARVIAALGGSDQADVAVAVTDGRRQPLCAAWRVGRCAPVALDAFSGQKRSVHALLDRLIVTEVSCPDIDLVNVNEPRDLHLASARFAAMSTAQSPVPEITVSELAERLADATLIDVREPDEYTTVHVPGARLIPLQTVPEHVESLRAAAPLTIICAAGGRSLSAAMWLAEQGIAATNVAGGTNAWVRAGLPTISGPEQGSPVAR